jgi:glycerol-3-phosphate dehydrogenase (NAD(P)+)
MVNQSVLVIGAGGWGTALAILLANKGHEVWLWGRNAEQMKEMEENRINSIYLPGIALPPGIRPISGDLAFLEEVETVILTIPSQGLRSMARKLRSFLEGKRLIINGAKGLEQGSLLRLSQVLEEELPGHQGAIITLSGPNHAEEVGRGLPAAAVVASKNSEMAVAARKLLMTTSFRVYTNEDLIGVELAGALKNVIALATGISDGFGLGDNSKAALITRGMAEIARLGIKLGAKPLTFSGLAGVGDLIVTCTSQYSRNSWAGRQLGSGKTLEEILNSTNKVIEGIPTVKAVVELGQIHQVELPIANTVNKLVYQGMSPAQGVRALMERCAKEELEDLRIF